ncbi:N-acetylmuramoyl-L-alanine amidase [Candidatus Dojkabacteria bacterium]|nr:N-acetylmuramoyl-L-alanine amidase [Candidatus Dojkabacteria bacterium]
MARVLISAGHTQKEPGAIHENLKEVELTRKIANKVTAQLRQKGIIVLSVPPELDLPDRINWINQTGYLEETEDICIEFHINDGGKSGLEGWYKERGKNKSEKLVNDILELACKEAKLTNQGAKSEYDHPLETLAFVHNTNPTSALIECLYIDNPEDQNFLKDDSKLEVLATGIVNGVIKFFDIDDTLNSSDQIQKSTPMTQAPFTQRNTFPGSQASYPQPIATQPRSYGSPYSYGPTYNPLGTSTSQPKSREEIKEMVRMKYQQILGRKVNDQDLNYFVNLGLNEDQMIRRLVQSQEHAELIKNGQEFKELKPKHDKLIIEVKELKTQVRDKDNIIKQQNGLIVQKNRTIQQLQMPPQITQESPPPESPPESLGMADVNTPETQTEKESFFDKLLRRLNDIFD